MEPSLNKKFTAPVTAIAALTKDQLLELAKDIVSVANGESEINTIALKVNDNTVVFSNSANVKTAGDFISYFLEYTCEEDYEDPEDE